MEPEPGEDAFERFTEQSREAREEHSRRTWAVSSVGALLFFGPLGWIAYQFGRRRGRRER